MLGRATASADCGIAKTAYIEATHINSIGFGTRLPEFGGVGTEGTATLMRLATGDRLPASVSSLRRSGDQRRRIVHQVDLSASQMISGVAHRYPRTDSLRRSLIIKRAVPWRKVSF